MRIYQLFFELIVIGGLAILATLYLLPISTIQALLPDWLNQLGLQSDLLVLPAIILLAWISGFLINIFSVRTFKPFYKRIMHNWMLKEGNPSLVLEKLRYRIYISPNSREITRRIEYHYSLIRISRCVIFESIIFSLPALFYGKLVFFIMALLSTILALTAYYHSVIRSIKAIYYAWMAINNNTASTPSLEFKTLQNPKIAAEQYSIAVTQSADAEVSAEDLSVLAFSGGTGFREINMALARRTKNITRVVPIWDNGGSSKALRISYDLMPVGDIRHALMTQAHGEGRVGSVVKLFNWRLSGSGEHELLKKELNSFVDYKHPLICSVEQSLGHVIMTYLKQFAENMPDNMELRNGSIGNFVLVGAYLAHNKDLNTAIYVFRQLCSIQGNVWPVSLHNHLHINAILDNNDVILGQEKATKLDRSLVGNKIQQIVFNTNQKEQKESSTQHIPASCNPMVSDALKRAEVIVYGPGSFFTSILPHIMVDGIADEISKRDIPKIFIGNLLEDNESHGYSLADLIEIFVNTANQYAKNDRSADKYITHILVNKSHAITEYTLNDRHYLKAGNDIKRFTSQGISLIIDDFESPWKRGQHDVDWIADYLMQFQR